MKKLISRVSMLALLAALMVPFVACDNHNGPAEELGENLDNAAEEVGNAVENATDGR